MIRLRASIPALCSALALSVTACGNTDTGGMDTMPSGSSSAVSPTGTTTGATTSHGVGPVGTSNGTSAATTSGASGTTTTAGASGTSGASGTNTNVSPTSASGSTTSTGTTGTTTTGSTTTAPTSGEGTTSGEATTSDEVTTEPAGPEPTLVTSAQNAYWTVGEVTEASGAATITVNDQAQQTFYGFGGSVNEKGWEALLNLTEDERKQAMEMLFDDQNGANFRYVRIPIGASDYATSRYTLNDNDGDYAMENFSIARDEMLLIPYIKAALEVNPNIHFSSSPWTPPKWMKNNNSYDGGSNATIKDDAQTLDALALYLAKFVQAYAEKGIEVKAVYPQNEPGFADQAYPMCGWSSAQMTKFIGQHLGPKFDELGLTAEIWMGTMSNSQTDGGIGQAVMSDNAAKGYVKGFGMQWGMDAQLGTFTSYGMPVWQSEHKCGNYPWNPAGAPAFNSSKAPNDHAYAVESWGYIKNWISNGANGYMAWNMVLDTVGKSLDTNRVWPQNSLLTVDTGAKKLIATPAYYAFRHVSQYVDEGAKRLGTQGGDTLAFKNPDGSVVTVIFNSGGQAAQQTLSAAGKTVSFTVPGNGWATVNLQP